MNKRLNSSGCSHGDRGDWRAYTSPAEMLENQVMTSNASSANNCSSLNESYM